MADLADWLADLADLADLVDCMADLADSGGLGGLGLSDGIDGFHKAGGSNLVALYVCEAFLPTLQGDQKLYLCIPKGRGGDFITVPATLSPAKQSGTLGVTTVFSSVQFSSVFLPVRNN